MLFAKCLSIVEKLAAADPGNIELQRDLTIGLTRIGAILAVTGKRAEALVSFRRAAVILEGLAAREPDKLLWQADLGASYSRIGMALADSGESDAALAAYQQSLKIREKLAAAEPKNTERRRDVFNTYIRIGGLLAIMGGASKPKWPIAARSTSSTGSPPPIPATRDGKSDLSLGHDLVGDMLVLAGRGEQALAHFRKALAIRERLLVVNADNTEWQYALAVSHHKVGDVLDVVGDARRRARRL